MFRNKIALAFVVACICAMRAVPAQDDPNPLKVEPAYLFGPDTVYFKSLVPLDWEKIARKNFRQFDVDNPDPREIERHYASIANVSAFSYGAPLPPQTKSGFYYIFYSGGVGSIILTELSGTIVYGTTRTFDGMVLARAPGPGFVIRSDTPIAVARTLDLPLVNDPNVPGVSALPGPSNFGNYVYTDKRGRHIVLKGLCHLTAAVPKKMYVVTFVGDPTRYLFVVWGDKRPVPQEVHSSNLIAINPQGQIKWMRANPCEEPPYI